MSGAAIDTIVAPATPVGRSALAIVRIDGPLSGPILLALSGEVLAAERMAVLRRLSYDRDPIDEVVAVRYVAPKSFTGNDLVELTLHGNPLLIDRLLAAVVSLGGRIAEPGEFTERAVLNGKLDLVQAEAVADLIAARTSLQARLSLGNLSGLLSTESARVRSILLDVIARLEASLDFAEEGYAFISRAEALARIEEAEAALEGLSQTYRRGRSTMEGINLVIVGRPNAGKSTLLNRLVGTERAIVTPVAGTTRDILRETIVLGGLPVTIADTAGLRESSDPVESIGVARAREAARGADLILYLIDSATGETSEDRAEVGQLGGAEVLIVRTKSDLLDMPGEELAVSAVSGAGFEALLLRLDALIQERFAVPELSASLVNRRQQSAITGALAALLDAKEALQRGMDEQMVLVDLGRSASALGSLTGAITREDIYSEIFSRFCIGK